MNKLKILKEITSRSKLTDKNALMLGRKINRSLHQRYTSKKKDSSNINDKRNFKKILNQLKTIRKDVEFIKSHMFDPDCILTKNERLAESQRRIQKRENNPSFKA